MRGKPLQTVIETPEFIKQINKFLGDRERLDFINFIAKNPLEGDLIKGTGGARKIRWHVDANKGKSGGARIIYYYHNEDVPIFLLTAYKKNQKENLTEAEKIIVRKIIKLLATEYER